MTAFGLLSLLVTIYLVAGVILGFLYLSNMLSDPEERPFWRAHVASALLVALVMPLWVPVDFLRQILADAKSRRG